MRYAWLRSIRPPVAGWLVAGAALLAPVTTGVEGATAPQLDLSQRFLLLATERTSTMQEELDGAAAAGYRIVVGSPTRGSEMAVILENVSAPAGPYEYLLLATSRTSTMQREMDEAASRGFRLLPSTMISKPQVFGGDEIVLIMEKAPEETASYNYLLLATTLTSTLQREVEQAVRDDYEVVGMVSRDEHIVILERRTE